MAQCDGCKNAVAKWQCSACANAFYCCEECQIKDWGSHQFFCGLRDAVGAKSGVPDINKERYMSLKFKVPIDLLSQASTADSAARIKRIMQTHLVRFNTAVATQTLCRLFTTRPELKLVLEPNDITFLYCPGQEAKFTTHYFQIWLKKYEGPIIFHYRKLAQVTSTKIEDIQNKFPRVPRGPPIGAKTFMEEDDDIGAKFQPEWSRLKKNEKFIKTLTNDSTIDKSLRNEDGSVNLVELEKIFKMCDTTGNLDWIVQQYIQGGNRRFKDFTPIIGNALLEYKSLTRKRNREGMFIYTKTQRDINTFEGLYGHDDYEKGLLHFLNKPENAYTADEREILNTGQAVLLFENHQIRLIQPLTTHASIVFGRNTSWCTSREDDDKNMFMIYTDDGVKHPFVIMTVKSKVRGREKYGMHLCNAQLHDENDKLISNDDYARLRDSFLEGFKKSMMKTYTSGGHNVEMFFTLNESKIRNNAVFLDLVPLIIEHTIDVNEAFEEDMRTLLFYAPTTEIAKNLIKRGANVNARDMNGETPLFRAKTVEIAQILIDNGADVNAKTEKGHTPIFSAIDEQMIQLLIANGADINETDKCGQTPLFSVLTKTVTQLLVSNGAKVNAKDNDGKTPLHVASSPEIAQILIDNGADVNAKDNMARTPLFYVRTKRLAQFLIDNGADVNAKDSTGLSLLQMHKIGNPEVKKFFLK